MIDSLIAYKLRWFIKYMRIISNIAQAREEVPSYLSVSYKWNTVSPFSFSYSFSYPTHHTSKEDYIMVDLLILD